MSEADKKDYRAIYLKYCQENIDRIVADAANHYAGEDDPHTLTMTKDDLAMVLWRYI